MSSCTLDFEQFDTRSTPIVDAGEDARAQFDADSGQIDADVEADDTLETDDTTDIEETDDDAPVGSVCQQDADCNEGLFCQAGYCTAACDEQNACPAGSSCHQFDYGTYAGAQFCLADCQPEPDSAIPTSCAGVAGRDDLSCVTPNQWPAQPLRADSEAACLPDSDGDSVADPLDNCPEVANPQQFDRDGDGVGDACDDTPQCHNLAVDGILDYGTIEYPATDFFVPASSAENWIPVVGGRDADGNPLNTLIILDRTTGSWQPGPPLPFASFDRRITATGDGQYLITPGRLEADGPEFDRSIFLAPDGTTRLGHFAPSYLYDAVLNTTSLGQMTILGYESAVGASWSARRLAPETGQQQTLSSSSEPVRLPWHATTSLQGESIFYSEIPADTGVMRLGRIDPMRQVITTRALALAPPESSANGVFTPFIIPAAGDTLYVMERNSGKMIRVYLKDNTFSHIPEYDLSFEANQPRFISMVGSLSFIILDRPADQPTQLRAREFFLGCMPGYDALDTDGDGVPDIRDNCPFTANPDQKDTDFDHLGDICDDDADGDGIPNGSDTKLSEDGVTIISMALDTDNDGVPNAEDEDSDGDGIPDVADRYPLDTDNDGVPNWLDSDSDGDGYLDSTELSAGSDPLNPLSFPGSGYLTYIRDDGTTRTVEYAPLADMTDTTILSVESTTQPHEPRFVHNGAKIMVLSGAPDTATGVELIATLTDTAPHQTVDLGMAVRSAAAPGWSFTDGALTSLHIIHPNEERPGAWALSQISLPDLTLTPWMHHLGELSSLEGSVNRITFLGGPLGCDECVKPFLMSGLNSPATELPGNDYRALKTQISPRGLTSLVVVDTEGTGSEGYYRNQRYRPEGITELDSFLVLEGAPHLIASGRPSADSPYELWFYNALRGQWSLLMRAPDNLVELDWTSELSIAPEISEPPIPVE